MRANLRRPPWLLIALISVGLSGCQPSGRETPSALPTPNPAPSPPTEVDAAIDAVRSYYRAIDQQRYSDAYQLWGRDGSASGKTFEEFRSGFSETVAAEVSFGTPGALEGAAGSRYVDVPVRVIARLRSGAIQEFTGTYTMRRSVVDGATPAQRAWHIDSARLRQVK